jgi:hypothetical protein
VDRGQVWLHPTLPPSIRRLLVRGIALGERRLTVEMQGDEVEVSITGPPGLEVVRAPRPPLTTQLPMG